MNIFPTAHAVPTVSASVKRLCVPAGLRQSSPRLRAAVAAELSDLQRQEATLRSERETLSARVAELDAQLTALGERAALMRRLNGEDHSQLTSAATATTTTRPTSASPTQPPSPARMLLRGPAVRRTAVQVLLADPRRPEALHYRAWYELLREHGYEIAGKKPLAVFLTQLSRSPVVRRSSQSGVYELDVQAVARLRRQLDERQQELRGLTATGTSATLDLGDLRQQRGAVTKRIDALEKALDEAQALLHSEDGQHAAAG